MVATQKKCKKANERKPLLSIGDNINNIEPYTESLESNHSKNMSKKKAMDIECGYQGLASRRKDKNKKQVSSSAKNTDPSGFQNFVPEAKGKFRRPGSLGLEYDTRNHREVLFRLFGSVWLDVLPWCIFNVILTLGVWYLRKWYGYDFTINDSGHKFMSVLVSFLVVTRVNIAYNRFMESASCMTHLFRNSREIVMNAISFTRLYKTQEAMDWRLELCRRVIVLLKVTVSILEYNNKRESVWTHPILRKHEQKALLASFGTAKERYPIILSVFLRTAISAHEDFGIELHVNERLRLLQNNTDYIEKYHGLMKLISTPFPFPLLQMSRVFLFAWVLTLPFAVLHDLSKIGASVFVIFFMTFGFMGLEFVAMELDDPFGNDDNDLEIFGMSQVLYEDIYIFLYDIDGSEQGQLLRQVINDPELENQVQRNYHNHVLRRETVEASPMNQQLSRDRTFSSETSNIINDSKKSMRRNNLQRHGLPNVSPRNCRSSLQLNEIVSPRNMLGPLRERRLECAESTERNTSPNNDPTPIPCPGRRRLRRTSSGFSCIITEHLNRKEDECDENIDPGDDDSVYGSPI